MNSSQASNRRHATPTVRAVAEAAGCSVGTVSKALNGAYVSPAYRLRVEAAVEELGYVLNGAARSMRGSKTMTLGMVTPAYVHPRFEIMAVTNTMISEMEEVGYSTLVSLPRHPDRVESLLRRLVEHRVDGLFYFDAQNLNGVEAFKRLRIPIIAVGFCDVSVRDVPLVTVDAAAAFDAAYHRLTELGHQVAAEVIQPHGRVMHQSFPTSASLDWRVVETGPTPTDVHSVVEQLMTERGRPTAVLADYAIAAQILGACDAQNIRVPEDLSLVALTDSENAHLLHTPMSAIRTDYDLLGHTAAAAMRDALAGRPVEDAVVPNSVHWIERKTTGPASRS